MRENQITVSAQLPAALRSAVNAKLEQSRQENVSERLRAADPTLWGPPGTPEVADRLGWLTIAERMLSELEPIELLAAHAREADLRDVVLLGMGGSSLAPEVLRRSFPGPDGALRLHVLDSTDAARIRAVETAVDLQRTLFLVSSKSGTTIEPLSLFAYFFARVERANRFVAITDPGSGLQKLASEKGFLRTFPGDPDIGGRYSALSNFGIVPAGLAGIDARSLLEGAGGAWETRQPQDDEHSAGVWMGAALSALACCGRDKLTFLISPTLPGLGLWLEQLVAESTGKQGKGILPVAEEPVGEPREYGPDRVFAYLPDLGAPDPASQSAVRALCAAGHPVITVPTRGPSDLGRIFLLWELAVAVAGWGLQINPFDQPNVQQAKDATTRVLEGYRSSRELPAVSDADEATLRSLLADGAPPDYMAIMAYTEPSREFDAAVAQLRTTIRAARKTTTTFGYGPRFLHSTGQYHKGGPRTGRFLQLMHDGPSDLEIPGQPYTFTTLKHAQAIGDLQTLRELGLPAERLTLTGDDPACALRRLTTQIKEML